MKEESASIKKAALLNAGSRYLTVLFQIIHVGILSRILSPEEFGIVAIINVFIVFFQLFADMGLGTGVVQNKDLTEDDTNHIFSFTVFLGFFLAILFSAASFIIAKVSLYTILVSQTGVISEPILYIRKSLF